MEPVLAGVSSDARKKLYGTGRFWHFSKPWITGAFFASVGWQESHRLSHLHTQRSVLANQRCVMTLRLLPRGSDAAAAPTKGNLQKLAPTSSQAPLRSCLKCTKSRRSSSSSNGPGTPTTMVMKRRRVSFCVPTTRARPSPKSLLDELLELMSEGAAALSLSCTAPRKPTMDETEACSSSM